MFVELLVERRIHAGLSQQAVAKALGWSQSMVARIKSVQRRMDVIELARMADVIEFDLARFVQELRRRMRLSKSDRRI